MTKTLTYVEIDLPYCALIYGEYPCEAVLGVTGDHKCFNTKRTCQDRLSFTEETVTLRFAEDVSYLPDDIEAIPNLVSVDVVPSRLSLGESLGDRASVTTTHRDHPWPDTAPGFDKYFAEREYDPVERGSFWPKFRARHPFVRGCAMRVIQGELGQTLAEMRTRHFLVESFNGPDANGGFSFKAHDILKLTSGDRSLAPRPNNGFMLAAIDDNDLTATLSPAGIGDEEYATSGWVNIGNKEIVAFTRVGDVLTITRGQLGTAAVAHDAQEFIQTVLYIEGEDPADIFHLLFTEYAEMPEEFIPHADWLFETETFLGRLYTAVIPTPTPVDRLASDLLKQAAMGMWTDEIERQVRLRVLREISATADRITTENRLRGSLQIQEQPEKRRSQVIVYYGVRDPLRPLDDHTNYLSVFAAANLQSAADYGSVASETIYAYWIPAFGRTTAERLATLRLSAFQDPPRRFTAAVSRASDEDIRLGTGYQLSHPVLQDDTGAEADVPIMTTRVVSTKTGETLEAEESLWTSGEAEDLINRRITIDADTYDFDLLQRHNQLFPELTDADVLAGVNLEVIILPEVRVGSTSTSVPAFWVKTGWPVGFPISITNRGRIQGAGGQGGMTSTGDGHDGAAGGPALRVDFPIDLDNSVGEIWSGGGGGGSRHTGDGSWGNGGGGAGFVGGQPGTGYTSTGDFTAPAAEGTSEAGGNGSYEWKGTDPGPDDETFGDGGDPGEAGYDGRDTEEFPGGDGGAPGTSIDGLSDVTFIGDDGDIRGPTAA